MKENGGYSRMKKSRPDFLVDMIETSRAVWIKGWAEGSAGNLSLRIEKDTGFKEIKGRLKEKWTALDFGIPGLAGECFLMSGAGCYMRDVERFPEKNIGMIEILPRLDKSSGGLDRQSYPLFIGELKSLPLQLLLENTVLFYKVVDYRLLVPTEPVGQGNYKDMERL